MSSSRKRSVVEVNEEAADTSDNELGEMMLPPSSLHSGSAFHAQASQGTQEEEMPFSQGSEGYEGDYSQAAYDVFDDMPAPPREVAREAAGGRRDRSQTPQPKVSRPSFEELKEPRVLISACSYSGQQVGLPKVIKEADALAKAYSDCGVPAKRIDNPSVEELATSLKGCSVRYFLGHGDGKVQGEAVPVFVSSRGAAGGAGLETVSHEALVQTVRCSGLQTVVLNGCCTSSLAEALHREAGVRYVICWDTIVIDEAARVFGVALATQLAQHVEPKEAFEQAKGALLRENTPGVLDESNFQARVTKFSLCDPADPTRVHTTCTTSCEIRCRLKGRLLMACASVKDSLPPLAAGVPRLLHPDC